jgi:hypothetical protein
MNKLYLPCTKIVPYNYQKVFSVPRLYKSQVIVDYIQTLAIYFFSITKTGGL